MTPEISLRHQIHKTLSWLLIFPLLAIWPFISAFPLFGILEATRFDLNTFTNCLFALTGFFGPFSVYRSPLGLSWAIKHGLKRDSYFKKEPY